jgi:poly(A) polymerase
VTHPINHAAPTALLKRPRLLRLLEVMNGDGEETRIVGGAVRNALLDRPVTEVDLATTASTAVVDDRARRAGLKTIPTGIDHGTITVIVEGETFEVTTLREDVETDGRRAVVHFGRDFAADALRRDFTINALFLDRDGRIHDYTDGVKDLAERQVRFIGDAHARIREDYLRILRFFRFYAEYAEAEPDSEGLAAAGAERAGLAILSRERIRHELMKILMARRSVETIRILAEHGFLTWLLGGAAEYGRFERVVAETNTGPVSRLAALAVMVPDDADRLRERLRLSNDEYRQMADYGDVLGVLRTGQGPLDAVAVRRLVAEHGIKTLALALTALAGEPLPILRDDAKAAFGNYRKGVEPVPVFPLRGADFMEKGVPPGPRIGRLLAQARQVWLDSGCPTDSAATQSLLERMVAKL